jgi:hypothetical protein
MPVTSLHRPLGSRLPWFQLESIDGIEYTSRSVADGQPALLAFICNHSPYVRHIELKLAEVMASAARRRLFVLAIASNDTTAYPTDGTDALRDQAARAGFDVPYCLDKDQDVAKAFGAHCTPEFFLYDDEHRLVYHGQFDSSRPGNDVSPSGDDLEAAITSVLDGEVLANQQTASFGCSIKWRAGNEPAYLLLGT